MFTTICILLLFFYAFPACLAYTYAPLWGRRRWLWTISCLLFSFFAFGLLYLLPSKAIPTLDGYLAAYPHCATRLGINCRVCGSRSIRLWRDEAFLIARQRHICNHCGTTF